MQNNAPNSPATPENASNGHDTPNYGEFGKPENATPATPDDSVTQGGQAAPSIAFAEQRGSTPQNLDPAAVRAVQDAEYEEQREGWAKDDPRYGGGTRNWPTNEPANHTDAPAPEGDEHRENPNVGKNDNPDEFSAFRPDEGRGIPGSGKGDEMPKPDKE
ncbi:hypothetical protein [Hymenobacter rubripertinctus]|uniref:Uncharacterized protein n=1 Tax=Hymenobacter rubripertinctus TaxID=2029981 RepID=A0A418QZB9_9BACT|nr:hypothetical protein [Hymenobacter rubripertinctus]RIY10515.1 hypothetical protein D0T11_09975 [Hymenobacter rubripertinctus]